MFKAAELSLIKLVTTKFMVMVKGVVCIPHRRNMPDITA